MLKIKGSDWFARVDVQFGGVQVSTPASYLLMFVGMFVIGAGRYLAVKNGK